MEFPALTTQNIKENSVSLYRGEPASVNEILTSMNRLAASFPRMGNDFFNILAERIRANNFTSSRLRDAVNYLIDNFSYKELNVADIIRFDKKVKLYTYRDVCNLVSKGEASMSDFVVREVNGCCYRVKKSDLL